MMSPVDQYTIDCEFIKEILCTFLVQCYNILKVHIFAHEIMKKTLSKDAHNWPIFFQYCKPAQNQPKSHILYPKNGSLCNFYIITLPIAADNRPATMQFIIFIFDNNHPRMLKMGVCDCMWVVI